MSEQIEQTSGSLGRRSALKKAAAAGAVVWAAPAVLSSTAHAVDFVPGTPCTLKCQPSPTVKFDADVGLACQGPGGKWAELTFTVTSGGCPCSATGTIVGIGATVSPNPASIKATTYDPATGTGTVLIGGGGNGALPNGTYIAAWASCVSCTDRSGDTISRTCFAAVSFTFQPANGPCSQDDNVGEAINQGVSCEPAVCGPCPGS